MKFIVQQKAIDYLSNKDVRLKEIIEKIGPIEVPMREELFPSLIRQIVGQQISMKAMWTVWNRLVDKVVTVEPESILKVDDEELQQCGLSFRKVTYMKLAAEAVQSGELDLESLYLKTDEEVIKELTKLKGIGLWTAEMLLIFSLGRPNVLSYDDLAIRRGLRMIYHHKIITRELFEKYRRRYSPYGSVAGLYIWEVAEGALPEMKDYAPHKKKGT